MWWVFLSERRGQADVLARCFATRSAARAQAKAWRAEGFYTWVRRDDDAE